MLLVVMSREKSVLRALLLKLGIVVAISSAGFVYSRLRARMTKPYLPPPPSSLPVSVCCSEVDSRGIDQGEDYVPDLRSAAASGPEETSAQGASVGLSSSARHGGDVLLLQEFNDLVEEFDTSRAFRTAGKDGYEQEIKHLRNMVRVLREREQNLEVQLLEYYGLKEQESAVEELKNQLKINNMETKLFTLKIASLQSENQRLEKQLADHEKVVAELQTAKSRIKVLKKKLRHEVEQNREQILSVQKRVARLQEQEVKASADNHDAKSKLGSLKVLEGEAEELRQSNARLQIENSELARKLESTQILANSVLENPEAEALNKMRECLMLENEDLKKRMEQLQEDRCADAEELVYLRWINACLRYELRNFTPIPGKTVAKDLNKSLSHKSEEKAKQLILEYARAEGMDSMDFDCDQWSCSQAFYSTDNGEADDLSFGNSSAKKTPNSRRIKFFKNLRRLILGKDVHNQSQASSTSKTDNPEDFDSSTWSSGRRNDFVNMLQSNSDRFTTPPQSSPSTFLDVDQIKDTEKLRRNSDCGPYGNRKHNISGRENTLDSPLDRASYSHRKSDVMKFAEALKQSGTGGEKPQRAASII
ncbi:hypothetical protein ES332_A05G142500v1 [Gossypium tomentosum]|uniref:Protein CHUP1, chloroplastic n=2 Tax=Gossypium tomentosum TaxID=34277 RepID=A0A5D2QHT7_GOSTO|nr:hypothetical protein ES332_A05G142500v1 [Gossypium tomentosum]TYI26901.1 hypothetical protein ES332_A05G142500v1 [Gossypium tomentosum]